MRASQVISVYLLTVALGFGCAFAAKDASVSFLEGAQKYDTCLIQSTFSFLANYSFPPKSEAELRKLCSSQAEGFKCLKERTKGSMPLLRRGLVSYAASRSKHHKKYCSNPASEPSRKFVAATKCIMEKRYPQYRALDLEFVQTLAEIARRNYTGDSPELKYICCSFYTYRTSYGPLAAPECAEHKPTLEELAGTIVSDDISLVCDDEEKLAKLCPKLAPLEFKRVPNYQPPISASTLAIFLIGTLGEPNPPSFRV